jgi:hypothetical protein
MNDQELEARFAALSEKIDAVYISVEKTRKYFLATIIVSLVAIVLPLIGLAFALPAFISNLNTVTGF